MTDFKILDNSVIINFSNTYCKSKEGIINSEPFLKLLKLYLKKLSNSNDEFYLTLKRNKFDLSKIKDLFLNLIIFNLGDLTKKEEYVLFKNKKNELINFVENFYDYWRKFQRYGLVQTNKQRGIQKINFIEATTNFNTLVLKTYRSILENIYNERQTIYRQLSAGINAGLRITKHQNKLPIEYDFLNKINMIESVVLNPPFIVYTKSNTRKGFYEEVYDNPLLNLDINKEDYLCFPINVGESLAFVYFNIKYMAQGVSLSNLFSHIKYKDYQNKKPDLIYIFGLEKENTLKNYFFQDKKNDLMIGICFDYDENDYFGYMKKMLLTLHNIRMIKKGYLPIHGAMVNIKFKNNTTKNICLIGDSGAGKSETLEALKGLNYDDIIDMNTVFDDMGTFVLKDNKLLAYGTETGAFVRLDDLDTGYAYTQMDRAIFINPNKTNSRVILPVSNYDKIMKGYNVDILLYANNYENKEESLELFNNKEDALKVFKQGRRKTKGTTSETGIVDSFFANPFGPYQFQKETNKLLDIYFEYLFKNNILVGQLYTKLSIEGYEFTGPKEAAINLYKYLK